MENRSWENRKNGKRKIISTFDYLNFCFSISFLLIFFFISVTLWSLRHWGNLEHVVSLSHVLVLLVAVVFSVVVWSPTLVCVWPSVAFRLEEFVMFFEIRVLVLKPWWGVAVTHLKYLKILWNFCNKICNLKKMLMLYS